MWSEYKDSNLGPPGPKPGALPDCATLRLCMERVGRVELRDLQLGRLLDAPCPVYPHKLVFSYSHHRNPKLSCYSVHAFFALGLSCALPPGCVSSRFYKPCGEILCTVRLWLTQSPPVLTGKGPRVVWCPHHDSNTGPTDYKSVALPAEL